MKTMRIAALLAPLFLIGACVKVGNIQQSEPVRTLAFSGSAKEAAQCAQPRLRGKTQDQGFGSAFVIYDSVKGSASYTGVSHYAVTLTQVAPDRVLAELRVRLSDGPSAQDRARSATAAATAAPGLTESGLRLYWGPVEDCAAQAKRGA